MLLLTNKANIEMTSMQKLVVGSVQQVIEQIANYHVKVITAYIRKKYWDEFPVQVNLSYTPKRKRGWGGRRHKTGLPFISLPLHRFAEHCLTNTPRYFREYDHYIGDPVIGEIRNCPWQKNLVGLICHEMAHAIQHTIDANKVCATLRITCGFEKDHGEYYQAIYADLRREFVNGKEVCMPYTLCATKEAPKVVKSAKPKRSKKTGLRMEIFKSKSGWFIHKYYDAATNVLVGTMASKPRYVSKGLVNGEWEDIKNADGTFPKNHPEARKIFLGR